MLERITGSILPVQRNGPFVQCRCGMLLLVQCGQFCAMHFRKDAGLLERIQEHQRSGKYDLQERAERTGWLRSKTNNEGDAVVILSYIKQLRDEDGKRMLPCSWLTGRKTFLTVRETLKNVVRTAFTTQLVSSWALLETPSNLSIHFCALVMGSLSCRQAVLHTYPAPNKHPQHQP